MVELIHTYNYDYTKHLKGEVNDGKSKVETAGYISDAKKIQMFFDAGIQREKNLSALYDYYEETDIDELTGRTLKVSAEPELYIDPTRDKNYDMADATMALNEIQENINEAQKKPKTSEKPIVESGSTKPEIPKDEVQEKAS